MKTHLGTIMTRAVLVGLIGIVASFSANAEERSVRKTAEAIRKGEIKVGKEYSLRETGRFHIIHAGVLGLNGEPLLDIKCGGCHSTDQYPPSYLYLRKDEFFEHFLRAKVRNATLSDANNTATFTSNCFCPNNSRAYRKL